MLCLSLALKQLIPEFHDLEPLFHFVHDFVGQEFWKGQAGWFISDQYGSSWGCRLHSKTVSPFMSGVLGLPGLYLYSASHPLRPSACGLSISRTVVSGLQKPRAQAACPSWAGSWRPTVLSVPVVKAALVQFRFKGKGARTDFPMERGSKALQLSLILHTPWFLAVLVSGVFWESDEGYRKCTVTSFYMQFWWNHLPWRLECLK